MGEGYEPPPGGEDNIPSGERPPSDNVQNEEDCANNPYAPGCQPPNGEQEPPPMGEGYEPPPGDEAPPESGGNEPPPGDSGPPPAGP